MSKERADALHTCTPRDHGSRDHLPTSAATWVFQGSYVCPKKPTTTTKNNKSLREFSNWREKDNCKQNELATSKIEIPE